MDMKRKSLFEIFAILLMAASYSCDPNPVPVHFGQDGTGTKSVELRVGTDFPAPSKSSLGAGIESLFTGAVLAVYDHETGILEAEIEIPADMLGNSMLISLPMGGTYDMYLIGNLRLLADDGSAVLPSMPATSAGLETFDYRLDGGAAGDGFRRERFDEVSRWGIPLCWSRTGVDPLVDTSVDISMQRLFAKVVLKIDHSGFAGTDREAFVNGSVHIRQANCRLQPFAAGGSRAAGPGDVIVQSDYEDSMENGLVKEFVFYVPENMQGVLMPDNTSAEDKDMEGVEAASGIEGVGERLTFLEFVGRLNMAESGFEGDVTYRFFLGRDDCTDFTVERNKELRISLKFNPLSIFEPDWKLDSGGLTDSRRIFLSGDLAGMLPQDKEIYVRRNREGTFNLNIVLEDGGPNMVNSVKCVPMGYQSATLSEPEWSCDFWSSGLSVITPVRRQLDRLGISVDYSDGRFSFRVSDPKRFVAGRRVPLTLYLYPGEVEVRAVIVTAEDLLVEESGGLKLDEDFYIGQRRTLNFKGFAGKRIYYLADQDDVSAARKGSHVYNKQWKTAADLSAPFVSCKVDAAGEIILPYQDYDAYASQSISSTERLDVCAFYPNGNFKACGYGLGELPGKIIICSDDIHNDGITEIPLNISMLVYDGTPEQHLMFLPFDGKPIPTGIGFLKERNGEAVDFAGFDPEVFGLVLKPDVRLSGVGRDWHECIRLSEDLSSAYLFKTTIGDRKVEDEIQDRKQVANITFSANKYTGLYSGWYSVQYYLSVPTRIDTVHCNMGGTYFSETGTDDCVRFLASSVYICRDPEQVEIKDEGPVMTYRCKSPPYEVIEPVIKITYGELSDSTIEVLFDEAAQPLKASNGEPVPGGLLVPYGKHTLTMTVTNRWDGRKLVYSKDYTIKYASVLVQFAMFSPKRMGTIYYTGRKNVEYLKMFGNSASLSAIEDMVKILGSDAWHSHFMAGPPSYRFNGVCHMNYTKYYTAPPSDFDVKFYNPSASVWTEQLAAGAFSSGNWLMGIGFHKSGVPVGRTYSDGDAELSGSPYNEVSLAGRYDYIFRNTTGN